MSRNKKFVIFIVCSLIIVCFIALSLVYLDHTQSVPNTSPKTFVYEWPSWAGVMVGGQRIVNGTLRLEITFESTNDSVNIVAKINDDDYNGLDFLGLVFDISGNGFIDLGLVDYPRMLFACNLTYYTNHGVLLSKDGTISTPIQLAPQHSFWHTCTLKAGTGYTFNIRFSKNELSNVKANMVYIYFYDQDAFIKSELRDQLGTWVSLMIEGWQ